MKEGGDLTERGWGLLVFLFIQKCISCGYIETIQGNFFNKHIRGEKREKEAANKHPVFPASRVAAVQILIRTDRLTTIMIKSTFFW